MPALTRLRIGALAQLADELRFSPKATLVVQLARAEALVFALDLAQAYPEDWVIYQITRHRVERSDPALILGAALQAELSAFVERISHDAALTPAHAPSGALRLDELRARWSVSERTIQRWRRSGLIARRERLSDGKSRLVFSRQSVEAFEARCASRIERAAKRSRVSLEESSAITRSADQLRSSSERKTRNAVAAVIARASRRSRSTIRAHLGRASDAAGEPMFRERGPITPLEARRISLALRDGESAASLAGALGRSAAAIRRADRLSRLSRLRAFVWRDAAVVDIAQPAPQPAVDAAHTLRSALERAQSLRAPTPRCDATLADFLASADAAPQPPDAKREALLARAQRLLVARCCWALRESDALHPAASSLDELETALRLAWRLRCALVQMQLRVIRSAIEERLEGSLADIAPTQIMRLHLLAMRAACVAAGRFDPRRGGRLSAPTAIALARALAPATRTLRAAAGRARRADIDATPLSNWTLRAAAWAPALAPRAALIAGVAELTTSQQHLLQRRLGLDDHQPHTTAQLAEQLGVAAHVAARRERQARSALARQR